MNKDQQRRSFDGIVFDSILEMRFYRDVIRPKMASGDIITCQLQKEYVLQPMFTYNGKVVQPITYVADFYLVYKDGREEVIDTKGSPSSTAVLKRKLFWLQYPEITYRWLSYTQKTGWISYDELKKIRRQDKNRQRRQNHYEPEKNSKENRRQSVSGNL